MEQLVSTNPITFGWQITSEDKEYFKKNLIPYIEKKSFYHRTVLDGKYYYVPKYETNILLLTANYMIQNFTLKELEYIFSECKNYKLDESNIESNKRISIRSINHNKVLSLEEAHRLKRKVWDTNSITYGLILDLIKSSDLFHKEKRDEILATTFIFK